MHSFYGYENRGKKMLKLFIPECFETRVAIWQISLPDFGFFGSERNFLAVKNSIWHFGIFGKFLAFSGILNKFLGFSGIYGNFWYFLPFLCKNP